MEIKQHTKYEYLRKMEESEEKKIKIKFLIIVIWEISIYAERNDDQGKFWTKGNLVNVTGTK